MNFLSKEAPLNESISNMQSALFNAGFNVNFSQEKHPLQNCYSVNLSSVEAPKHIYSNGKGIISEASMASAFGEYIERLQTNIFFSDFYLPKRQFYPDEVVFEFGGDYMNDELRNIYNPDQELCEEDLVDFNSDYEEKIVTLPFIRHSTKEKTYIPINILNNLYISNGLATGNTPKEAKIQALSEIFERYAKIQIIKNGYSLPKFPEKIIKSFPKVYEDVTSLRKLGYIVEVLDASLGGKFPVTAISLINQKNSTLFVSFGAHPILEVSLERTMTELMQGRSLDDLDSFECPTFDMSVVSDSFNLESHYIDSNGKLGFGFLSSKNSFDYTSFSYKGKTIEQEYTFLMDILDKMGKESYLREYDYLGFYSCQIIVPGISEVYPIQDLIYNNKNIAKEIRKMVLNFKDYDARDIMISIESLENSINMEKYIGVIFENNFSMGEFKSQMHLLLEEYDEAFELLEYSENKIAKIILELSKMQELELNFEEYEDAMYNIYSKKDVHKALRVLEGDDFIIDTTLNNDYKNILKMYDKLASKKICQMK